MLFRSGVVLPAMGVGEPGGLATSKFGHKPKDRQGSVVKRGIRQRLSLTCEADARTIPDDPLLCGMPQHPTSSPTPQGQRALRFSPDPHWLMIFSGHHQSPSDTGSEATKITVYGYCELDSESLLNLGQRGDFERLRNLRGEYTLVLEDARLCTIITSPVGAMHYFYTHPGEIGRAHV